MIDALPLGEIAGQHAPWDAAFRHIKDGIEHGPHTQRARASTVFSGWDHIFAPLPFLVGQVAWICFFIHIPMLHNPRRLFRQALSSTLSISEERKILVPQRLDYQKDRIFECRVLSPTFKKLPLPIATQVSC